MLRQAASTTEKSKRSRTKNHKTEDQNINLHKFSSKLESISAKHSKEKCAKIFVLLYKQQVPMCLSIR